MESLVIVGASLAGLSAARAARRQGFTGRLVIIGDDPERPYDRPPLSKEFLSGQFQAADLTLEIDGEQLDAEWLLGVRAVSFDPVSREVTLEDGRTVRADLLVIATGASARQLPELTGLDNVLTLRTLEDARKLRALVERGGQLVVLGAGFIGAEVASTAHSLGLQVTVLEKSTTPLRGPLGAEMGSVVARLHEQAGVELLCGIDIEGFNTEDNSVTHVRLADGRVLPADIVVVGIGAQPNVAWLEGSGIDVGNGVVCDAAGRTTVPGSWPWAIARRGWTPAPGSTAGWSTGPVRWAVRPSRWVRCSTTTTRTCPWSSPTSGRASTARACSSWGT